MATTAPGLLDLDPIQGLVDYVLEIKPYHSKIFEVLFEYVYADNVNTTITEFMETIAFDWGGIYSYSILSFSLGSQTVTITGDLSNAIIPNDIAQVDADPTTEVVSVVYDSINDWTVVTLLSLPAGGATLQIQDVDITYYFEFAIDSVNPTATAPSQSSPIAGTGYPPGQGLSPQTSTNAMILTIDSGASIVPSFTVEGNATTSIQVGSVFEVTGSVANDGLYRATYLQYEPIANTTTIGVSPALGGIPLSLTAGGGGSVVPYRYI